MMVVAVLGKDSAWVGLPVDEVSSLQFLLRAVSEMTSLDGLVDSICEMASVPDSVPDADLRGWILSVASRALSGAPGDGRVRAPRVNAAGWCTFCSEHGCQSDRCVELWLNAWFEVCGECGGVEFQDWGRCESCYSGMVEMNPPAEAGRPNLSIVAGEGLPVAA